MIERHVCSLELSRRLAEAGFPQECVFAWWEQEGHTCPGEYALARIARGAEYLCAAPLLSEIIEQMPGGCEAYYSDDPSGWTVGSRVADSGQDAAAAWWLALRGEK